METKTRIIIVALGLFSAGLAPASTNQIGGADGSFESGLGGSTTAGDASTVSNLGSVLPTEGASALLLTTAPDSGVDPSNASVSSLLVENFQVDAAYGTVRLDYNFLTNEPRPSLTNDSFRVSLIAVSGGSETTVLVTDTFEQFFDAPWTGYLGQTGFRSMVADVSAYAGTAETLTLQLRIEDAGDGRRDSAVLIDNLRLVEPGAPTAVSNIVYSEIDPSEPLIFDGRDSFDDGGIVDYTWDFGNGFGGFGALINMDQYTTPGIYQGTLTVTDDAGLTDTTSFTVVVGGINRPPIVVSEPNRFAAIGVEYRYQVVADDPELVFGDSLTYSLTEAPAGMTIDATSGLITWTPPAGTAVNNAVTVVVTDSEGLTGSQSYSITIGPDVYVATITDDSKLFTARSNGDGSFSDFRFVDDLAGGSNSRGLAIADFDADGDFDLVTGYNTGSAIDLWLYNRDNGEFTTPAFLGSVAASTGGWLMDMAAEDFDNDGRMDIVFSPSSSQVFLGINTGMSTLEPENFFASDFETGNEGWGGAQCATDFQRDDSTSASGTWSMRVFATGNSCLSIDINPSEWYLARGSTVRFDYRVPPGVPAGLLFNVSGRGWIYLGGAPAASGGPYPVSPLAVDLVDDGNWHSVEIDLREAITAVWPDATLITEFEWWTDTTAVAGQEFWFDDFRITRPRVVDGFAVSSLPSTGGNGRGTDAGDANNDGNMDFVRARTSSGFIYLYTGDGDGNFTTSQVADPGSDPYGVVLADFDNDGNADIIANNAGSGDPYFFVGNGNGTFQAGVYVGSLDTNNYASYGVFDFDSDGNQDIVASTYTTRTLIAYPGNGDGSFGAVTLIGNTGSNALAVAAPAGRFLGQPFAIADGSSTEISEDGTITFDGTGSYDDGSIIGYEWDFGDGNTGSGATIDHTYTDEGIYQVVLTVTDNEGYTDRRSLEVTVNGQLPTADAGGPYTVGEEAASNERWTLTLDGTGSTDPETGIARYEWDFDASDGISVDATGPTPFALYTATGTFTVTLTVYDGVGQADSATSTVTVAAGAAPTAAFTGPTTLGESDASLGLWAGKYDASGASDAEGIASTAVDWGDGTPPTVIEGVKDDFGDGELATNPNWTARGGNWFVADGVLNQTDTGNAWRWLQDLSRSYTDFELEVDFRGLGTTNGYMGLVFHNQNASGSRNTFLLYSRDSWDFWRVYDWQTGTILADAGTGWDPDIWYHLRLRVVGNRIRFFVTPEGGTESEVFDVVSPNWPQGGIGLLSFGTALQYDNLVVRPIEDALRPTHTYSAAGDYTAEVTVTDHAGQIDSAAVAVSVSAGVPPTPDSGGPYTLNEGDALGSRWTLVLDATASSDDVNVERYTVDFGDGTSYTTGIGDGSRTGYFVAGTDLYGLDVAGATISRIVAIEDSTTIELINLETRAVIDSIVLNRFGAWNSVSPGDGVYYKLHASKPVVAYFKDNQDHAAFMPSLDGDPVGREFHIFLDANDGYFIYAFEDAAVIFYNPDGSVAHRYSIPAGEYRRARYVDQDFYRVVSTGRIAMQTSGNDGYTTVPSDNGSAVGDLFYFATVPGTTGAFGVFAYEATDIEVFDLDSGASLYTRTMAAGESWFQSGLGAQRLRLESTGAVEVWAGSTEGGSSFVDLGDDISYTTGRDGTQFVLHNLRDGIVIFAPNDGTDLNIDSGALTATLDRDQFLHLAPGDFPSGSGIHTISATQPVVVQTLGRANVFNNLGTYVGGVTARHEYAAVGTYDLTLTATDNAGQTNTVTTTVEVQANDAPIAVINGPAVADETFADGGDWTVEFDAGGSSDDFGIFSYEWDFGDGTTGTGVDPTHVYDDPGTYVVTLVVTDNAGQQATTTFTVEVTFGDGPVADAGGPYTFGEDDASYGFWTAILDGSGSTDDAGIFDYKWLFTTVDESFDTALDRDLWTADDSATVTGGRLVITGSGAWGPRGFYSAEAFDRPDGTDQIALSFTGQVLAPSGVAETAMWGAFSVLPPDFSFARMHHALYFRLGGLEVYEDGSRRGTVGSYTEGVLYEVRLDILESGARYYIREAGAADWTPLTGYSSLNRSASPLRVGAAVSSETFQFDNIRVNESVGGETVTRKYTEPGTTEVTLVVRDNALQSSSDTTTITIQDGDSPVAAAGGPYTAEVGSFVNFNGLGSTDDNAIQTYDWVFGDTTGGPVADGSATADLPYTGSGPTPRHFYQETGSYTATLTVTDNTLKSDTATAEVQVIVGDAPVAAVNAPTPGARNGPPVYFDATPSTDDFGIVEYRWDFDDRVDRDGDGDATNDIDAVGANPYHVYSAATQPAGSLLTEGFDGVALDSGVWTAVNATQSGGVLSVTGTGGWGGAYFYGVENFDRSARVRLTGTVRQEASGTQRLMWGLKDTRTSGSYTVFPHAIYFNAGTLQIYELGSFRGTVGSYTPGVTYEVRIDLGSTNASYYIREQGAADWTALTSFSPRGLSTSPLKPGGTVLNGTGEFDDILLESLGHYVATLTVEDGAGQTSSTQLTVPIVENLPPDVITVPWVAFDPLVPHETYNGKAIRLKGIVRDADPVTYQWDFGDGTQSPVLDVTDPFDLSVTHTYPDAPVGTPFTATLTVTDSAGNVASDVYRVVVRPLNLTTEINIAIDEGLWYLHQEQTRSSAEGYATGYWTSDARASATASSIQAFEVNGHLETGDHQEDPYAETVMRGLRQLFRDLGTVSIASQLYGEPDSNGNGIGIETGVNRSGGRPIYQGGQVMDAIASSGTPLARTVTGADGIKRRSYFDILTDMVDQFSWGQTEQGAGGGWRYAWNNSIDNSAAQWGAIGILAAEDIFGIPAPLWVKERNIVWLNRSYQDGAGWGYTSPSSTAAGTPSGLVQMIMDDLDTRDFRWISGEKWMADRWTSQYIINEGNRPYYPYYALTKAMRLALPEPVVEFSSNGFDWFRDPELGLARTLIDDQLPSGRFPGSQWIRDQLRSAWGVIILSRSLFVQPPVADAGEDRVWGVDIPLEFDGSASFHRDPFRSIVKYEWDFDGDGNFDFESSEPTATYTYTAEDYPEESLPQTVIATLRVTDNNTPALTDIDTVQIIVAIPPHPPVADVGGPYTCTAGVACPLDGTGSFDIDPTDFITRYEWDLDGFPFEFTDATGPTPEPVFPDPGVYSIGLRVFDNGVLNTDNDNEPLSDDDFGQVTVVENLPPVADANGPYTVNEGSFVTLDGTGSSDPNGDPLSYAWDLDGDAQFDDALGASPNFTGVDDGVYPVALEVTDTALTSTAQSTVTVLNVAPTVEAGPDATLDEGTSYTGAGSFTDPGEADTWTATVDYGDGSGAQTLALNADNTFSLSHTYVEDGLYTITVAVTDDDGGTGSATVTVTVNNLPPVVEAGPDAEVLLGDGYSLATATFTDAGIEDTHTASIDWGDGSSDPGTVTQGAGSGSVAGSHNYAAAGTYTVTVTVTDDEGASGSDTLAVTVTEPAGNAPIADAGGPYTVNEGSTVGLDGSGSSDPDNDPLNYAWDLDNDGQFDEGTGVSATFQGVDDGVNTVRLRVSDGESTDTAFSSVTVLNVAPTVTAGPDASINEGDTYSGGGSFADPGELDTWTATVDYGDGSGAQSLALNADNTFSLSHAYAEDGVYTITVVVTDDDGGIGSATVTVTVNNLPPVVEAGPDAEISLGESYSLAPATFTDAGIEDTHTATIDWGDGSSDPGTVTQGAGSGSVAGSHLYAAAGTYTVTVTVTDDEDASGSDTLTVTVPEPEDNPPIADAGGPYTVTEGSAVTLDGSGSSDPDGDALGYAWDLDNDGQFDDATGSTATFQGVDDGAYTVGLQVTAGGLTATSQSTVTVLNVAPTVTAGPDATLNEGDTYSGGGSFADPGELDTWTATVDYGDGSGVQSLALNADNTFSLSHDYAEDGVYTITVVVTDDDGGTGSATVTVTVNNLPPVVEAGPDAEISLGESYSLAPATFTDAGVEDIHTATIDWGDGSSDPGTVTQGPGSGSVAGSHLYAAAGTYTVTVTVTDDEGASGSDTLRVTVTSVAEPEQTIFDLYARAKSEKIDLVWTPVAGAQSYNVYRSTSSGGPYALIAENHVCDYCAYADFGLTNNQQYCYVVTSVDDGLESLSSNEACATPTERTRTRTRTR